MPTPAMPILCLDVMSTLVYDPFYKEMPAHFGMSFDELIARKDPRAWVDFEFGAIDETTFGERFFADRTPIDVAALRQMAREHYRWIDGMEELLTEWKALGIEMHALSNYPNWYHEIEAACGLSRYLKWSFVSCDMGLRKPDPQIFREVAQRLGRPPAELLFVDDAQRNVDAARKEGWHAIRFESADSLRSAVQAQLTPD